MKQGWTTFKDIQIAFLWRRWEWPLDIYVPRLLACSACKPLGSAYFKVPIWRAKVATLMRKYLGNSFACSLPNCCLPIFLNMTRPATKVTCKQAKVEHDTHTGQFLLPRCTHLQRLAVDFTAWHPSCFNACSEFSDREDKLSPMSESLIRYLQQISQYKLYL